MRLQYNRIKDKLDVIKHNAKKVYYSLTPRPIAQHKLRLLYYPVPKAATSSTYTYLIQNSNLPENIKNIPAPYVFDYLEPNRVSKPQMKSLSEYTSFAIVRDPYSRIWACYHDKIIRHKGQGWCLRYGFTRYNALFGKKLFSFDMNFDEFVSSLCLIPELIADEHFRSQYRLLPIKKGNILVDYIIRFEDINQQFNKMCNQMGIPAFDIHTNKSTGSDLPIKMSPTSIHLLNKRYRRDFELLHYTHQ